MRSALSSRPQVHAAPTAFAPLAGRFAIIALAALLPALASAQERPDPTPIGNGPRALGLSFAVSALAEDVSAIGWNPAGLAHVRHTEGSFVSRFLLNTTKMTPPPYDGASAVRYRTFRFHRQPGRAEKPIAGNQRKPAEKCKGRRPVERPTSISAVANGYALNQSAKHETLCKGGDCR